MILNLGDTIVICDEQFSEHFEKHFGNKNYFKRCYFSNIVLKNNVKYNIIISSIDNYEAFIFKNDFKPRYSRNILHEKIITWKKEYD